MLPLLFNFALEFAIRRVQVNQNGLKLHVTHELVVYADDDHILDGNVCTIKRITAALVSTSKVIGL